MTCADSPCHAGASCTDAAKTCDDNDNPDCAFTCDCPKYSAGRLCNLYRRCFAKARVCYQTDYEKHDYSYSTLHCLRQGNATLPVILNQLEASSLRLFINNDPAKELTKDSIWLAAEGHRTVRKKKVHWQWIDGLTTSRHLLFTLCFYST